MFFFKQKPRKFKVFSSLAKAEQVMPLNKPIKVDVADDLVCMVRTPKGIYAFEELCPHAKAPLWHGQCEDDNTILCPFHRYKFDLATGRETTPNGYAMKTFVVEVNDEGVFILK